ncbi:hypothetical protein SNE40_001468 [Patella caerulea]|uniref:Leucine-rich repeat and IQ domain-containing protein 3 n=1 Tax=Patella caerulea TaxID=87958 RepID=A0AAN8Q864_PATCE
MVSIPDWNKITGFQEASRQKNIRSLERYYRQRDEEIIRQAEKQGYFVIPSKEFILNNSETERKCKDLNKLQFIKLTGLHLRKPGDLSYCVNVTICILHNNFLTKIDGLGACRHLIKLDLHGNQLAYLPGMPFWSGLRKLRSLILHDNPLARFDILHDLSVCPKLTILTLYDSPLYLKKNYRHHVVNSIWTLKALDNYIISDEEIIEDAVFGPRFAAMAPQFRLNLCPQLKKNSTYKDELEALFITEAKMNFLLSHFSPVLIIQRYVRGFITRLRLGQISKYRGLKHTSHTLDGIPHPPSCAITVPHAASAHESMPHFNSLIKLPKLETESQEEATPRVPKNLETGDADSNLIPMNKQRSEEMGYLPMVQTMPGTATNDSSPRQTKNIFINLAKLHQETSQILQHEISALELQRQSEMEERMTQIESRRSRREKRERNKSRKPIKSIKHFFGPVVTTPPSPVPEYAFLPDIDDDAPITRYRICGFKPRIAMIDATTEMILARKEAGNLVRDAEAEHHRNMMDTPKPKIHLKKLPNNDQRIFNRVHGSMAMSCLFAVQKAYKEREKAEKAAAKMEHILNVRDEKVRAKERIHLYHQEKRNRALKHKDQDQSRILETLENREIDRLNYIDKRQDLMSKTSDMSRNRRQAQEFITEFNNQHTSVSNALMKHDRQARQEDKSANKFDFVQGHRTEELEQQETVKKYLEHRQLMRQGESSMMKETLNSQLLQEANERLFQAQQRVGHLKAKRDSIQAFYPLPPSTVPKGVSTAPVGLSRWEAGALSSAGRIGRHPTMVT